MRVVVDTENLAGLTQIKVYEDDELVVDLRLADHVAQDAIEDALEPLARRQREQIDEFLGGGA